MPFSIKQFTVYGAFVTQNVALVFAYAMTFIVSLVVACGSRSYEILCIACVQFGPADIPR